MHTPSKQKWLERNRPPRVQISYDVEIGDAIEKKELPLVVGVMAGLSGMPVKEVPLAERRFVEIDRDNFNTVMARIGPRLDVARLGLGPVPGVSLGGIMEFASIDDFDPENVVRKVPGLNELLETRNELRDLMAKLDGNAKLEGRLNGLFVDNEGKAVDAATRKTNLESLIGASASPAAPAPAPEPGGTPEQPGGGAAPDDKQ